ncbi:biotin-dependent carboxyltransferase family protein [Verrucomicrobiaceae bacterium 5K15]|uniref:Biotin-dependent carboxyltransferase family protein n=1 Tax=Oceaniferula flava TaxID=2800421 RepID=A0AAE2VC13_9BACT|nr:biotin-dependent carboxyltransferase family protein [Oceaniferula flavus]MBK1855075.1 biotin-dependent carboxyltransferase family protein [Oceaniferula flavus]MBM1136381.1 biotin-dependent carboxyltransferase family protein [Oceaniferula flavus]
MMIPVAKVLTTGIGLSYQDLGRFGYARYGVAPAGPMDLQAHDIANQLVGNDPEATCLELTLGGGRVEILRPVWIALTGAASSPQLKPWSAREFLPGETLTIHPARHGIWSYLAFAGGLHAPAAFGSRSRHERSDTGAKITSETLLSTTRTVPKPFPGVSARHYHPEETPDYQVDSPIRVHAGPHDIASETLEIFFNSPWKISNRSDRTGFRLEGKTLRPEASIPSLPTLPGCIQLPPSGEPIVTLNDGPTTGGYPLLGIIDPADLPTFTQHAPGSSVYFNPA